MSSASVCESYVVRGPSIDIYINICIVIPISMDSSGLFYIMLTVSQLWLIHYHEETLKFRPLFVKTYR